MDSEEKSFCYQKAKGFTHKFPACLLIESESATEVRFILVLIIIA